MGTPDPPPDTLCDDVRAMFSDRSQPCTPLTAAEVAAELGCTRHTATEALDALAEGETLETKDVGADGRVWWRPIDGDADAETSLQTGHTESPPGERATPTQILEAAPVSIFVVNRDGEVDWMNDQARDRLQRSEAASCPLGKLRVYDAEGDVVPVAERPYVRVLETGEPVSDWDGQIDLPSGRVWVSMTAVPLGTEHPPEQVVVTVDNATKFKEQTRRLERHRDDLEVELREVYERVDEAFMAFDEDWRFTYVNTHAAELIGREESAVLGEKIWEEFPESVGGVLWKRYHEAMETQESVSFESYLETLGIWAEISAYPSASGLSVYVQDISERKRYEGRLQLLNETVQVFLRADSKAEVDETVIEAASEALDVMGVSVYRFDDDQHELYPAATSVDAGFIRQEFPRIPADESTLTGYVYATGEPLRYDNVLDSPHISHSSERTEMRAGMFVPMGGHGVLIGGDSEIGVFTQEDQRLFELLGANAAAAYDRVEHERELRTRTHQQEVVSELGRTAIENVDLDELFDHACRLVADALDTDYCKVLDLDSDDGTLLLRHGVGWQDDVVGEAVVSASESDSQASYTLATEGPVVVKDMDDEVRFSGPDLLRSHDVKSGVSTIIGTQNDPWGILGAHDTERKRYTDEDVVFVQSVANILAEAIKATTYQDQLEGLVSELESSNEKLEQFAYIASHDLQEPLRMVSNYLQLIERRYRDELDDDARDFIDFAVDGAERMREMIDGLLVYSRVDTQGRQFTPTDCQAVVDDVLLNLQMRIAETGAEVNVGDLPTVTADRRQLEQVFQNLLSNALKYHGDDPPRIDIGAEKHDHEWVFSVADDGLGIDPRRHDQIFQVFERLHTHDEYPGTGIGLSLCQKIVERHGGRIWVESQVGDGSVFYFSIPLDD